jgi:MFS family permease
VKNVARVLLTGSIVSLVVIIGKLFGRNEDLKVGDISIPLQYAWLVFVVLTIAHGFTASFLVLAIRRFIEGESSEDERQQIFDEVKAESNPFIYGLIPRSTPRRPGSRRYSMDKSDPSTWIAYFALILLVAAILPWHVGSDGSWEWSTNGKSWLLVALAMVLGAVNWLIGSVWVIVLSQLKESSEAAKALLERLSDNFWKFLPNIPITGSYGEDEE